MPLLSFRVFIFAACLLAFALPATPQQIDWAKTNDEAMRNYQSLVQIDSTTTEAEVAAFVNWGDSRADSRGSGARAYAGTPAPDRLPEPAVSRDGNLPRRSGSGDLPAGLPAARHHGGTGKPGCGKSRTGQAGPREHSIERTTPEVPADPRLPPGCSLIPGDGVRT